LAEYNTGWTLFVAEVIAIACDHPKNHGFPDAAHWTLDMLWREESRTRWTVRNCSNQCLL